MLRTPAPKQRMTIFQYGEKVFLLTQNEVMYMLQEHPEIKKLAESRGQAITQLGAVPNDQA